MKITKTVLQTVFFPEIPVRIFVDVMPRVWTMETRDDGIWFRGGERAAFSSDEFADVLALRAALFAANTPDLALEFLNKYYCTWENEFPEDEDYSYSDFCATRRLMRRIVGLPLDKDIFKVDVDSPNYHLSRQLIYAPNFQIHDIGTNYPHFALRYESNRLISALGLLSWIERRRKIRYRFCKRDDCGKEFVMKTRHEKIYCTAHCAHLVQTRKTRERQRLGTQAEAVKE